MWAYWAFAVLLQRAGGPAHTHVELHADSIHLSNECTVVDVDPVTGLLLTMAARSSNGHLVQLKQVMAEYKYVPGAVRSHTVR